LLKSKDLSSNQPCEKDVDKAYFFEYMSCPRTIYGPILNKPEAESAKEQTGPLPSL